MTGQRLRAGGMHMVLMLVAIVLVYSGSGRAQDSVMVPVHVHDALGFGRTLTLGFHSAATPGFDKAWGEMALPPFPPVPVFDARFLLPDARALYRGDGSYADIRPLHAGSPPDTFLLRVQSAEDGYPVTLAWDPSTLAVFDSAQLTERRSPARFRVDMRVRDRVAVEGPDATTFVLILWLPDGQRGNDRPEVRR